MLGQVDVVDDVANLVQVNSFLLDGHNVLDLVEASLIENFVVLLNSINPEP